MILVKTIPSNVIWSTKGVPGIATAATVVSSAVISETSLENIDMSGSSFTGAVVISSENIKMSGT